MRRRLFLLLLAPLLFGAEPFLAVPYLNLGDNASDPTRLAIIFHTPADNGSYSVEVKNGTGWGAPVTPVAHRISPGGFSPHLVQTAMIGNLQPGREFEYRVLHNGQPAFQAKAMARKSESQPYRAVIVGDFAYGNSASRAIGSLIQKVNPDCVVIPGDIVYEHGRISEYRRKLFPALNSDAAPVMRSRLVIAAPGNHDVAEGTFHAYADLMAYFYYWKQPLNGVALAAGASNVPPLQGGESTLRSFLESAGEAFPRLLNFSYDYGNAHWTIIDGNTYVDWTSSQMRSWLEKDLQSAQKATWRFVVVHHPPFNSARSHFSHQQIRWVVDLFEKYNVDIVFGGHVHNYQRTYPLRFVGATKSSGHRVDGRWTLDRLFNGASNRKPTGIIYIITGGGGGPLDNKSQDNNPSTFQEYTLKLISKQHSLSVLEVDGRELKFRQLSEEGAEIDSFAISK